MIRESFVFLEKIGIKKEQRLWKQGLADWLNRYNVLLYPAPNVFPSKAERPKFVSELFDLLRQFKNSAQTINNEKICWDKNGVYWRHFRRTSMLEQFLTGLRIYPARKVPLGIRFPKGGSYSPEDAIDALIQRLRDKTAKYQNLKWDQKLNDLCLVVYYNRALLWNTPYDGINGGIDAAVAQARVLMRQDHGPFDKVFLFLAFEPGMRVFMLWP